MADIQFEFDDDMDFTHDVPLEREVKQTKAPKAPKTPVGKPRFSLQAAVQNRDFVSELQLWIKQRKTKKFICEKMGLSMQNLNAVLKHFDRPESPRSITPLASVESDSEGDEIPEITVRSAPAVGVTRLTQKPRGKAVKKNSREN